MLTERYGDPYRIRAAYGNEIKHWSQIKTCDADAYQKFKNVSVKLENISHLQGWNVLDTPDSRCMLLSKLPGSARYKWSRNIVTIRKRHKKEIYLSDFIHFFNDEALIFSDPIFSKAAFQQYRANKPNSRRTKVSSFPTKDDGKEHVEEKLLDCIYCSKYHTWIVAMHL